MSLGIKIVIFKVLLGFCLIVLNQKDAMSSHFIENKGQWEDNVLFYKNSDNLNIWICRDGIYLDQYKISSELDDENGKSYFNFREGTVLKMDFLGSKIDNIIKKKKRVGEYNYIRTNDRDKWAIGVGEYEELVLEEIYDNIDLKLYADGGDFRYDLELEKGADVSDIKFQIEGGSSLLDVNNDLQIRTKLGDIHHKDLYVFQEEIGSLIGRTEVECSLRVEDGVYSYEVGEYEKEKSLIIDPVIYSTYLGGASYDVGEDITADRSRNVIIVGYSTSVNFPTKAGGYKTSLSDEDKPDIIVTKFNIDSEMIFSTYIGGNGDDYARGVICDENSDILITGHTNSDNFPVTEGSYDNSYNGNIDAFLLRLDKLGNSLDYSTYFGSSSDDAGYGIDLDTNYNPVITGTTNFAPDESRLPYTLPIFNAAFKGKIDGFVSKFDRSGNSLMFSGLLGGSLDDYPQDLSIDPHNNIYVTGMTRSYDFPIAGGNLIDRTYNDTPNDHTKSDIFITKISSKGSLMIYSTYLGGSDKDVAYSIEVDDEMNTYVCGITKSVDFPITSKYISGNLNAGNVNSEDGDAFVTKMNRYADSLLISTYVGGSREDKSFDLNIDEKNQIYLIGATNSSDLPTTSFAYKREFPDSTNYFDVYLMKFSADMDSIKYSTYYGGDNNDIGKALFVESEDLVFITGSTSSSFFPVTNDAFDLTFNDSLKTDVFYTKILLENLEDSDYVICSGSSVVLSSGITSSSPLITMEYEWQPVDGLNDPTVEFPVASPEHSTQYRVKVTTSEGEIFYSTVIVSVVPFINTKVYGTYGVNNNDIFKYSTAKHFGSKYRWTISNGVITKGQNTSEVFVKFSDGENGIVKCVETSDYGCKDSSLLQTYFVSDYEMTIVEFGDYSICDGDTVVMISPQEYYNVRWNDGTYGVYDTINTAGEVYFIGTDNLGNPYQSDIAEVSLLPKPAKPKVLYKDRDRELLCLNKATEYIWYRNNNELYGEKKRTLKDLTSGTYYLVIKNSEGCSSRSNDIVIEGNSVVEENEGVRIYPNPTSDFLIIEFDGAKYGGVEFLKLADSLNIYDNMGRVQSIKIEEIVNNQIKINLNEFNSGFYVLRVGELVYTFVKI